MGPLAEAARAAAAERGAGLTGVEKTFHAVPEPKCEKLFCRDVAGIAAFVLFEKAAPGGRWIGRLGGAALVLWGLRVGLDPWL